MRKGMLLILLFFSLSRLSPQGNTTPEPAFMSLQEKPYTEEQDEQLNSLNKSFSAFDQGFICISAGPQLLYNAQGLQTAPSPISFSMGAGGKIPFLGNYLSFSPYIKGWSSYYIWLNDKALPGTLEKRTSLTLHALIDIPLFFHLPVENSLFSLGLGISLLARYGFAVTVLPDEEKPDIKKMNAFYWQKARFLYPCLILAWDYVLENGTSFGFEARAHYPVSSALEEVPSPIQNALLSVSARFFLPQKWQ